MTALKKGLSAAAGFLLILAMLIGSIRLVVFDHGFYLNLYDDLNLAAEAGVSEEDLEDSIFMMLDYVLGNRDDMNGEIVWKGRTQPTFNEREISHMKDVRDLWLNAEKAGWIFLGLSVLFSIAIFFLCRRSPAFTLSWLARGFVIGAAGFAVILVFLGIWMITDFTSFWIQFHHIFFSNSLWLLDPSKDFMIVICPEVMFSRMIARILTVFCSGFAVLLCGSWFYLKRKAPIGFERS